MRAEATRPFLADLRRLEQRLALPIPERVRILRELEYDLEGLRDRFLAEGLTPESAAARALEALVPDPSTLSELGRVHTPLYRRMTRTVAVDRLRLVERSALVVATGSVLLLEALALLGTNLLGDPSPFLWPVLGLGALLFAAIVGKAFELWVKRDPRAAERGLGAIVGLSATIAMTGFVGLIVDSYGAAARLAAAPDHPAALVTRWLVRDCALVAVAILLTMVGALTWFVLTRWLESVRGAHRQVLGFDR